MIHEDWSTELTPQSRKKCIFRGARKGYYAGCARGESERARQDREWLEQSRAVHEASEPRDGSPRVHESLKQSVTEWEDAELSGSCARTVFDAAQRCCIGGFQA